MVAPRKRAHLNVCKMNSCFRANPPEIGSFLADFGCIAFRRLVSVASEATHLLKRRLYQRRRFVKLGTGFFQEAGRCLGTSLAGSVDFLNPSKLLIGGGVSHFGASLLASIRQGIYGRAMPLMSRKLIVDHTQLGSEAGLYGAGSFGTLRAVQFLVRQFRVSIRRKDVGPKIALITKPKKDRGRTPLLISI
jgi:ROK family